MTQVETDPFFTFIDQVKYCEISAADIVAVCVIFQVTVDENRSVVNPWGTRWKWDSSQQDFHIKEVYSTKVKIEYEFQAKGAALVDGHVTKDDDIKYELTTDIKWV